MIKLCLTEADKKKKRKVSGAYLTFTTGNPDYNCKMFNKRMGTDFEDQIKDATKEAEKEADAVETAVDAEAAAIDAGTGATVNVAGPGEAAAEAAGDAGAGDAGAGDGGAAGGEGGGAMGESLQEAIDLIEDKIYAAKLGISIELPDNIKIIDKATIEAELEKLEPEEEFEVGYVTPVYFYSELVDKFTLLKCTRLAGYTGVDYIEARANDDANKEKRLQVSKDAIAIGNEAGRHLDRMPLAGKEAEFSANYASTNKIVKQKTVLQNNYNTLLFYPRVGSHPVVTYFLDLKDGKGYFEVSRELLEKTIFKKLEEFTDEILYGIKKDGTPRKPTWSEIDLAKKIEKQLASDAATIDAVSLVADKNAETRSKVSNGVLQKPQVRALYTNQIYFLKTPYATLGKAIKEDLELSEAVDEYAQVDKMRQLENGTRGFNAAAASDEKLKVNRKVCIAYGFTKRALPIVEAEMRRRGLLLEKVHVSIATAKAQYPITAVDVEPTVLLDVYENKYNNAGITTMLKDYQDKASTYTVLKKQVLMLLYAMAVKAPRAMQCIVDYLTNKYDLTKDDIKSYLAQAAADPTIMQAVTDAIVAGSIDINESLDSNLQEEIDSLTEAKREVRRYYIRPQNIYCANKAGIIKALIAIGDKGENCSVYSLKNLVDNEDVHKLTNNDIIYYYDEGVLYDKNHVRIMDYDLYVKKEEKRKHFTGTDMNLEREPVKQEYEDRLTVADLPETEPDIYEAFDLDYDSVNAFGETLTEAKGGICCICGEEIDGYGNNPEPVKSEGRCCDACNMKFVIPARMAEYQGLEPEEDYTEETKD